MQNMSLLKLKKWMWKAKGTSTYRSKHSVATAQASLDVFHQCVMDRLAGSNISSILGFTVEFYSIQQTLNSGGAEAGVKGQILSFKLNVGHFPHLANLVTIIITTRPTAETRRLLLLTSPPTSRFGKAFPSRTD
ncbi:hypothetical protein MLD38_024748 [Melastoma candidum]|uniref:Uncharacterized protein n=1 Tax=Melastoma candidum TaxID=119954 RepID=A0ACB9NT88_9MYRT|nr:hypothetical protein MLD38_024748 [Melastoma candidum]